MSYSSCMLTLWDTLQELEALPEPDDWTPKRPVGPDADPADPYTPTRGATPKLTRTEQPPPGTPNALTAFTQEGLRHRYHVQARSPYHAELTDDRQPQGSVPVMSCHVMRSCWS